MTTDDRHDVALRLKATAIEQTDAPHDACSALVTAALAVMLEHYPPEEAANFIVSGIASAVIRHNRARAN